MDIGGESKVETHQFAPAIVDSAGVFEPMRYAAFKHEQSLDLPGLLGRALSASYVPKSGPAHETLVGKLRGLFVEFSEGGVVRLRYRTEVYLAEKL